MKYTPCGCITQVSLCGLSPHGELALQANVALTPYLKLGGCGNDSLKNEADCEAGRAADEPKHRRVGGIRDSHRSLRDRHQ